MRKRLKAVFACLLLLGFAFIPSHAQAGDIAERQILGFSPDGRYFAFEQYGIQDGSGFPYADIFLIDTTNDSWVSGSPWRVLLKDERAQLKWARRDVAEKAGNALKQYLITSPGQLLASNPPAELSANPYEVSVNVRFAVVPGTKEPWIFRLREAPVTVPRCTEILGGPAKGFTLGVTPYEGPLRTLQNDTSIPDSRGCPMRYAISDVIMHQPQSGNRAFAVLISVYSFGFEGPDRRFIAVTFTQP